MTETRLQQLLDDLHRELGHAGTLDAETRRRVEEIREDLARLHADRASASGGLAGRIEDASLRMESAHPRLAMTLGEIVDVLARLGI
jgi:hypothetical protein